MHLHSVFFIDENVGYVSSQAMGGCLDADCDKGSVLLKTTNGGDTWYEDFLSRLYQNIVIEILRYYEWNCDNSTPDIPNSRDEYVATTSDGAKIGIF